MSEPDWVGISGKEHRTTGPSRAWCYEDGEWCYPHQLLRCHCCDQTKVPPRWQGENMSAILDDIRAQVQAEMKTSDGGYVDALNWVLSILETGGDDVPDGYEE